MSEKRIAWEYCQVEEKYYENDWDGLPNQFSIKFWGLREFWGNQRDRDREDEAYEEIGGPFRRIEDAVSALGKAGWEMCAAVVIPREHEGLNRYHNYWFKRPL